MATTQLLRSVPWKENVVDTKLKDEDSVNFKKIVSKIAEKELRENDVTRKQCLEQMREWIRKNEDIENCLMDDSFLLRFLRAKKFSIPMAQQTLLKYLNLRKRFSNIYDNLDCLDPKIDELITKGYVFASPFRDSQGRKVIIYIAENFDPYKYNSDDMARVHALTYETLLEDDVNQILGFNHIGDTEGGQIAHVTIWSVNEFSRLVKWVEHSYPMRHKEINVINIPSPFKFVYDFLMSRVNEKLKKRVKLYSSLGQFQSGFDVNILPREYGGVMPMANMIELWKKELLAKRDRLLSYDAMSLLSDQGITRSRDKPIKDEEHNGSIPGSFRKLQVD